MTWASTSGLGCGSGGCRRVIGTLHFDVRPSGLQQELIEDVHDEEEADARALYRVLADIGGADLVGPARELDPGTYWRAPREAVR